MLFISKINNLEFNESLGKGFPIRGNCFITNDADVIERLLPEGTRKFIGDMFWHELKKGPVVYWEVLGERESQFMSNPNPGEILSQWVTELIAFFQALWIVEDNAADPGLAFCLVKHPVHGLGGTWASVTGPSTSVGMHPNSACSANSLALAEEYFSILIHYTFSEIWKDAEPDTQYKLGSAKGVPRLYRFFYFLSCARHADDLAIKISFYITCLEILFSTSASEIVHKLSERVAFFLGKTPKARKSYFQIVKSAYSIRSKLVHGDVLDGTVKIQLVAAEMDELLRQLVVKILKNEQLEKVFAKIPQDLEEHLTNMTLGIR